MKQKQQLRSVRGNRLTSEGLATFEQCPRRFQIEHEMGLRRANRPIWPWPLRVRDALTTMLEARDEAIAQGRTRDESRAAATLALAMYLDLARKQSHPRTQNESTQAEIQIDEVRVAAIGILENYNHHYRRDHLNTGELAQGEPMRIGRTRTRPVGVEVEYRLPTWARGRLGRRSMWSWAVKLDRMILREGQLTLVVRSFTSGSLDRIHHVPWYGLVWAAEQLARRPVDRVIQDIVRTKAPSIPAPIKCRSCGGTGLVDVKADPMPIQTTHVGSDTCPMCDGTGVGGISRAACDTEAWVLEREITRHPHLIDERARHMETLSRLYATQHKFVQRREILIPPGRVDRWLRATAEAVREITARRKEGYWPERQSPCEVRGVTCPYLPVCNNPAAYEDVAFFAKEAP